MPFLGIIPPQSTTSNSRETIVMNEIEFTAHFTQYLPERALPIVYKWIEGERLYIRISKPRTSKLGDFRVKSRRSIPAISVNGNLNPYSFLVTLAHEVAHFKDFKLRGTLVQAHGDSWKSIYSALLEELINAHSFPEDILPALKRHIDSPKAASCSDPTLLESLRSYDDEPPILLKQLPEGAHFAIANGQIFVKGELRRTRYKCREVNSQRFFLVHGSAEVFPVLDNKS